MPHNHPHIEILAPVGGNEHLIAAVRSGADAVYLGTQSFNARRNAHNFTDDELKDVVKYCHVRGVRLYLTLNTLVFNNELEAVKQTIINAAKSGVDALITQDLGVYSIAKSLFPDLPLHASTQMTVHNKEGAVAVRDLGFKRVVLARELSEREITHINSDLGIETEMFIHGAHCMSISGTCYLSQTLGERSANRGLCAQPCRLDFKNSDTDYCLSLKDMSLIPMLDRVVKTGVTSLKIEGRMKRPEYVAAAVSQTINALNGKMPDMNTLESVFSRSGFTNGYFTENTGIGMFGIRRREDAEASKAVLSDIAQEYRIERGRVDISISFYAHNGEDMYVTVSDGISTHTYTSTPPDVALKRATQIEDVKEKLIMTGNTPYNVTECNIDMDDGLFIPASKIGEMRRCVFDMLTEQRGISTEYTQCNFDIKQATRQGSPRTSQGIVIRAESIRQLDFIKSCREIILPMEYILKNSEECITKAEKINAELTAEAPEIIFPKDEKRYEDMLEALCNIGIKSVSVNNISHIAPAKRLGMVIKGGYGLNITNSLALNEYEALGINDTMLSFELSSSSITAMESNVKRGVIAYGRLPVMKTRVCPVMGHGSCKGCTQKYISDRMSKQLPILCRDHKYSVILSPVPVWLFDKEIKNIDYTVMYLTDESAQQAAHIFELAQKKSAADFEFTRGSFGRNIL